MSTELAVVRWEVTEAWIAERRAEAEAISFGTPAQYEEGRKAIQLIRETRTAVERRRLELNSDALKWTREVNGEAKRLTSALLEIEEPLKARKQLVDDEKARVKREAEDAKQRELEAKIRADREAEEARLRAIREAEDKRLAEERARIAAEQARLAEERKAQEEAARKEREAIEAERRKAEAAAALERAKQAAAAKAEREKLAAERAALEAQRRAVEEEKAKAHREEVQRQAQILAEAEMKERHERERIAEEERKVREAERQAEAMRRLEAIRPDVEKVQAFGRALLRLTVEAPAVRSPEALAVIKSATAALDRIANDLVDWTPKPLALPPNPRNCYMPEACAGKTRCQAAPVCSE